MQLHERMKASTVSFGGDHVLGSATAPVVILEYGCYCCPRETQARAAIGAALENFPGQVGFIYRHYPLVVTYPTAFLAAEAAEFCGVHKQFWKMHDILSEHAHPWSMEELIRIVSELGLDADDLENKLEAHTYSGLVKEHFQSAVRSGVRRVPALFINGKPLKEDLTADNLCQTIARAQVDALGLNFQETQHERSSSILNVVHRRHDLSAWPR